MRYRLFLRRVQTAARGPDIAEHIDILQSALGGQEAGRA